MFGDSGRILGRLTERYRFGFELFADILPGLRPLLRRLVEDDFLARALRDPLVVFFLEQAFVKLEAGTLAPSDPLETHLPRLAALIDGGIQPKSQPGHPT